MLLSELANYIGSLLEVDRFRDYCPNGVQVEGKSEVRRIATGVTASQRLLEAAAEWGADALLVHHGYFWRSENAAITGMKKRRIAHLLKHDMSLLVYHLPLDAHPTLGNNAELGRRLGFRETGRFGDQDIACVGETGRVFTLLQFVQHVAGVLKRVPQAIGDENRAIRRVAWCTGAAQDMFQSAAALGVDAFVTGEISEPCMHIADETGVAFIAAGHHATERYGIQALGAHLSENLKIEHRFFDIDNPA